MSKYIDVLEHHAELFLKRFPKIWDLNSASEYVATNWLPKLRQMKFIDGRLLYPKLAAGENLDGFVDATSREIVAVNWNRFNLLSEWTSDQVMNFDDICRNCGNLATAVNPEKGMMCRLIWVQNEILSAHRTGCGDAQVSCKIQTRINSEGKNREKEFYTEKCKPVTNELDYTHCRKNLR